MQYRVVWMEARMGRWRWRQAAVLAGLVVGTLLVVRRLVQEGGNSGVQHWWRQPREVEEAMSQLEMDVRQELWKLFDETPCNPLMVRLGWHDAGTYDKATSTGGPNGSIRFEQETSHEANAGLQWAVERMEKVKAKFPNIGYGDLYQLAGVVAVEHAGGPKIPFRLGRKDANQEKCPEEGRLPDGVSHLHDIFYRMGFNDQEIVALSGAHTLGRAHKDRSGFDGPWTDQPLKFDNSYFTNVLKPKDSLMLLPTDKALLDHPGMAKYVNLYAKDQAKFFEDYTAAHQKLSELGAF